jgi:putative endonuclease
MYTRHEMGKRGEQLAEDLLLKKGYHILARNWRKGRAEIDIIARDGDFLVIVEVKSRGTDYFGEPDEGISVQQADLLATAAAGYQDMTDLDLEFRFDIVNVLFRDEDVISIDHMEGAFHP